MKDSKAFLDLIQHLKTFRALPHRMEKVHQYKKLTFINDSKATNVDSTGYAIENFHNIYWILGGISKDDGIESLAHLFPRIRGAYLIGEASIKFAETLGKYGVKHRLSYNLELALNQIKLDTIDNEFGIVILSPACASLDQWKNFEERGNYFTKRVREIWL